MGELVLDLAREVGIKDSGILRGREISPPGPHLSHPERSTKGTKGHEIGGPFVHFVDST